MTEQVIDVHAHYLPSLVLERFASARSAFPDVNLINGEAGPRFVFGNEEPTRPVAAKLMDLAARKEWMDLRGIDHQLVGGWLDSFGYELPPEQGAAWSRYLNRCLQDSLVGEPRFTPLATVPLQDGALAAHVLQEAWDQGFGGVMIGTLPKGQGGVLDSPELDPFWEKADSLGAAIFLHPMFLCGEPRLSDYDLVNALGRIADTSIAVARLLYSGHLLKYPSMKVVLAHGGAALPFALGRLARNHVISAGKYADPRKGFEALYFDSVVFDHDALAFLVERAGDERVLLGSDAPFPIGDLDPRKVVEEGSYLGDTARRRILGGNATKIFRVRGQAA